MIQMIQLIRLIQEIGLELYFLFTKILGIKKEILD